MPVITYVHPYLSMSMNTLRVKTCYPGHCIAGLCFGCGFSAISQECGSIHLPCFYGRIWNDGPSLLTTTVSFLLMTGTSVSCRGV